LAALLESLELLKVMLHKCCFVRVPPATALGSALTLWWAEEVVFSWWSGGSSWGWNTFYCLLLLALLSGLVQSDLVHSSSLIRHKVSKPLCCWAAAA